ncbi:hypothetical protein thsrh120_02830 [Rhizobium sp. No.120]
MQNEISPRRAAAENAPRRGVQQAGRIGRANGKKGRSFCDLRKRKEVVRLEIEAVGSRMGEQSQRIGLRNNSTSAAAILWIHPAVNTRNVLASNGRHFANPNFGYDGPRRI